MASVSTRAELITSIKNPLVREVRRAALRGTLTEDGHAVAESFHLLEEALRSECRVQTVLAAASVRAAVESHVKGLRGIRVVVVPDAVFRELSSTETTQGVITLVRPPVWTLEQLFRSRPMVVVLDGVQDPGNAGAMLRTGEAFGASGAVFLKGTVGPWHPKTLRASAGSAFRLPIVHAVDTALVKAAFEQKRLVVYTADPRGQKNLADTDLTRGFALIVGSEGRGPSARLRNGAIDLRIPARQVESLNAAMAGGVILYEAFRQRMLRR